MLLDARNPETRLDREADFAIVGGGIAGIVLARLLGQHHSVIVIESGGLELDVATQALYDGEVTGIRYSLTGSRLRFFGGSSNHWGGWCSTMDSEDFEQQEWVEHSGWPIEYSQVKRYYPRAAEILDLGGSSFEPQNFLNAEDGAKNIEGSVFRQRLYRFSRPVTRLGEKFRDELQQSPQIMVLLNANVTDLVPDNHYSRIHAARISTLNGRGGKIRARHFILACGGIENARILLFANRKHDNRIGNAAGRVGRFFMEHPHVNLIDFVPHDYSWCNGQRALRKDGDHWVGLAVTMTRRALATYRCLNFSGHFFNAQCGDEELMTLQAMMAQAPNPESRVLLSDETDALGIPRTRLDWKLREIDWQGMVTVANALGRHFGRLGLGRVRIPAWLRERNPSRIGYGSHHMGTTRMSESPENGIVNTDCQVHGVENLYVAGSSIFTTAGAVNPTLTLTALALRLGEHLDQVAKG